MYSIGPSNQNFGRSVPLPGLQTAALNLEHILALAGGEVLNVLFAALIGGFALGMSAPNIQHFVTGCAAFARLKKVLNR